VLPSYTIALVIERMLTSCSFQLSCLDGLCLQCRDLFLHPPDIWIDLPKKSNWPASGKRHWNEHHRSFSELKTCGTDARQPCGICSMVFRLAEVTPDLWSHLSKIDSTPVQLAIVKFVHGKLENSFLKLAVDFGDALPGMYIRVIPLPCKSTYLRIKGVEMLIIEIRNSSRKCILEHRSRSGYIFSTQHGTREEMA
jgi:hypothetical protein